MESKAVWFLSKFLAFLNSIFHCYFLQIPKPHAALTQHWSRFALQGLNLELWHTMKAFTGTGLWW